MAGEKTRWSWRGESIKTVVERDDGGQSSSVLFQLYLGLTVAMAFTALLSTVALATVASGKLTSLFRTILTIY